MEKAYYKFLMDGISDMVFVVKVVNNSEFLYEFLNRSAMEKTGLTEHVLNNSFYDVYSRETADFFYKQYKKVVTSRENIIYEDSYVGILGNNFFSETTLTPIFNNLNECEYIVAVVKDITNEKNALLDVQETLSKLFESNERYHSLFSHNTDGILLFNLNGTIVNGNIAIENITGYPPMELIGKAFNLLVLEKFHYKVNSLLTKAIAGVTESYQLVIQHKTKKQVDISIKVVPFILNDEVRGIYGIIRDITEVVESTKKLKKSEKRLRIIAENVNDLITVIDHNGYIQYVSPSYEKALGYDKNEFIGKQFLHNVYTDDRKMINKKLSYSIQNGLPFKAEFRQYNKNGDLRWYETNGTPIYDDDHHFQQMVIITRDIHLKKEYEAELEYFAYHDSLTGLPNRFLFTKRFEKEMNNFSNKKDGLAVIMVDIDNFKSINDQMGHDIGDCVIKELGLRISKTIRDTDMVARLGGDEFIHPNALHSNS